MSIHKGVQKPSTTTYYKYLPPIFWSCFSRYLVLISKDSDNGQGARRKRSLPNECDIEQLYNSSLAEMNNLTCYVTAAYTPKEITDDGLTLTIGNGEYIGGFYNQPLTQNESYRVHYGFEGSLEVSMHTKS